MSSTWLKDNLFVAAALALPLVVVVFFLTAMAIPRFLVDDPRHDLLFALEDVNSQSSGYSLRFRVTDGRLFADARAHPGYRPPASQRLYRFDADSGDVRRIAVEIPAEIHQLLRQELISRQASDRATAFPSPPVRAPAPIDLPLASFVVPETENLKLLGETVAPDGYVFQNRYNSNRGLFGELFGMGSARARLRIAKNGRIIALAIPEPEDRYYYYSTTSLGWIE